LPVLDGSFPHDEDLFLELLEEMVVTTGSIYIHCISGRGRAPTAAAALLLARGIADAPAAAIEMVRKGRPVTALTRTDVRFLERIAARLLGP
jgi:protein-tyrosine phosphatase